MKQASLFAVTVLLSVPASAHPGATHEHEALGAIEHLVLTALPIVVAAGLVALAAYAYRRKA